MNQETIFDWDRTTKKRKSSENSFAFNFLFNVPGPWAPPFLILPSLKITALSYSWTTQVQTSMISCLSEDLRKQKRCCYLDTHEEGDREGDDDQEDRDDGQKHCK